MNHRSLVVLAVAVAVFWIGYDGGSYSLESRGLLAIATLWAILLAVAVGLWPVVRPPLAALVAGGLLLAFSLFTGLSIAWAASAERALVEANRAVLLAAVFSVAVLAGTRGNAGRWLDGLALGIASIGVLALASRLFPETLPAGAVPDFLPGAVTRLSWPVEYWNGLAILVALAVPLLLRAGVGAPHPVWRALAVGVLPALAATLYLTSSRGGFATALVGGLGFLVITPRRWTAAAAAALALAGSAGALAVLLARDELVNLPFSSPEAAAQGRSAALLILGACAATGLVHGLGSRLLGGVRMPRAAGWVVTAAVALALLAGLVAADPVRRFDEFREPPPTYETDDFVTAHLLSGSGSGRWQFWAAAVDQWRERPLAGHGAGSYEAWWAQHGSIPHFLRDAHSLYLETLGELGLVGFLLLAGALATGVVAGGGRLLAARLEEERLVLAAALAAFVAFLVAAGIDWMWELTAVAVVGLLLLGLLTGPATATRVPPLRAARGAERRPVTRLAVGVTAVVAGWLLISLQVLPLLTQLALQESQQAVRAERPAAALQHALDARQLQPWAASPYLQVALVHEVRGDLSAASAAIEEAIERDPENWRLWLVAARVETSSGRIDEARARLARAVELNPRSPLFASRN
jgi:hypothetical protein